MKQSIKWNHNNHYHKYLLRYVPSSCMRAIDIGCGYGEFASKLSLFCNHVDAIDSDYEAINEAQKQYSSIENI